MNKNYKNKKERKTQMNHLKFLKIKTIRSCSRLTNTVKQTCVCTTQCDYIIHKLNDMKVDLIFHTNCDSQLKKE